MIEAQGTVVSVDGGYAMVRMDDTGCGRCHEEGGCGGHNLGAMLCRTSRLHRVLNPAQASVGDRVTVVVAEGAVWRTAMLAYGIPLLLLILGAGLGMFLAGDGAAIAGGVLGLCCGWGLARFLQRRHMSAEWSRPYIRH